MSPLSTFYDAPLLRYSQNNKPLLTQQSQIYSNLKTPFKINCEHNYHANFIKFTQNMSRGVLGHILSEFLKNLQNCGFLFRAISFRMRFERLPPHEFFLCFVCDFLFTIHFIFRWDFFVPDIRTHHNINKYTFCSSFYINLEKNHVVVMEISSYHSKERMLCTLKDKTILWTKNETRNGTPLKILVIFVLYMN